MNNGSTSPILESLSSVIVTGENSFSESLQLEPVSTEQTLPERAAEEQLEPPEVEKEQEQNGVGNHVTQLSVNFPSHEEYASTPPSEPVTERRRSSEVKSPKG